MHDVFEIAFRAAISELKLKKFFADYFNIDARLIVEESEYWAEAPKETPLMGISIENGLEGLRTNVSGVSLQAIDDAVLADLAAKAANVFGCEAVIGDIRKSGIQAIGRFCHIYLMGPFGNPLIHQVAPLVTSR